MSEKLTIALQKGRLTKQVRPLLEQAGIDVSFLDTNSRSLIFETHQAKFLLVKAPDVPTYVRHGVADMGIVGKDILLEQVSDFYEMLDLKIGNCKFSLASTPDYDPHSHKLKRIATKYPTVTMNYFDELGEMVEIIKIEGSVEIAPVLGLADAIVDIVETGNTLRENGLVLFDDICDISARLIVNKSAAKRKHTAVFEWIEQINAVLHK